ncbi:hypothetical protein KIL84_016035 [Mauremys mutica]|uniref:Uncharacterized protein n=1 Tax=Mauremys mutica TaxID=74926 RepID=A0A9D3WUJ1_9SAUR|nr:hypothetical protein KIL84_016035 [Mauremys mutica]
MGTHWWGVAPAILLCHWSRERFKGSWLWNTTQRHRSRPESRYTSYLLPTKASLPPCPALREIVPDRTPPHTFHRCVFLPLLRPSSSSPQARQLIPSLQVASQQATTICAPCSISDPTHALFDSKVYFPGVLPDSSPSMHYCSYHQGLFKSHLHGLQINRVGGHLVSSALSNKPVQETNIFALKALLGTFCFSLFLASRADCPDSSGKHTNPSGPALAERAKRHSLQHGRLWCGDLICSRVSHPPPTRRALCL